MTLGPSCFGIDQACWPLARLSYKVLFVLGVRPILHKIRVYLALLMLWLLLLFLL